MWPLTEIQNWLKKITTTWSFSSSKKWFQDKKDKKKAVYNALKTLKDIIESNNSVSRNETKIKSAISTLREHLELLEEKKMGYLIPFVNGDLHSGLLTHSIRKTIPTEMANELIRTGDFTPLATENISTANTIAINIKIMHSGTPSEQLRGVDGTTKFLQKAGMEEKLAIETTNNLKENYPLLLGIAPLNESEQKNSHSTIIAQRKGFDLKKYQEEISLVKTVQDTLTKIAQGEKV